jgi:sugar phosphate isomerase/epimerase
MIKISVIYSLDPRIKFDLAISAPLEEVLTKLNRLGYNGVEYNISNPFEVDVENLRNTMKRFGLDIAAISTGLSYRRYGYSLSSSNEELRQKAVEFFKKYIEIARYLETYKVVIGLARGRCEEDCRKARERFLATLEVLDRYAEENSVILLLEPLNRYETDLINKLDEALEIIKQFKNIKILLDTFHTMLEERNVYDAILRGGKNIVHVHVADSNRLAPGLGMLDWEKIVFRLKRIGYNGYISIEARIEPDLDTFLRIGIETLLPLIT